MSKVYLGYHPSTTVKSPGFPYMDYMEKNIIPLLNN